MPTLSEQVIGMEKQAAIDFLQAKGIVVRIAMEDGVDSHLQGYSPGRINLTLEAGKVTAASEG